MKKHKKLIVIVIIVLLIVGLGFYVKSCAKKATSLLSQMGNSAKTATVEERDIVYSVSASGTITSLSSKSVTASLSGVKIDEVNVEVGDLVSVNDIICKLDSSDLEEKLEDAEYSQTANGKLSNIEKNSAYRNLNEAVTSKQIETDRANEKIAKAQENLTNSQNKTNDAYNAYASAHKKTEEAKKLLNNTKKEYESYIKNPPTSNEAMKAAEEAFSTNKNALSTYLTEKITQGVILDTDILNTISINDVTGLTLSSIYSGADTDISSTIENYINEISNAASDYADGKANLQTEIQAKTVEYEANIESLTANYNALLKVEEPLKTAYESKAEITNTYEDTLKQTIQSRDDIIRNSDASIAARKDSVSSTSINNETSKRNAESNVENVVSQINDCTVTSPISGIVTSVNVQAGDTYAGGALITVEDTSALEVTTYIDEYDISKVKVGQKVRIKTNATGDLVLEGEVKSVAPRATAGRTSVEYKVVVSILTKCDDLRLDMTAKIEIILEEKTNVITVPYDAVLVDEKGEFYVEVLDSGNPMDFSGLLDGTASQEEMKKMQKADASYESHRVYVTKGLESDYYVEVISDELTPGMTIVIPQNDLFSNIGDYMDETGSTGGF